MDVSINEVGPTLKTEPVDYDENVVGYDDDYYDDDDQADEDYTGLAFIKKLPFVYARLYSKVMPYFFI